MRHQKVLDYENPQTRYARSFPTGPPPSGPFLYRSGLVFGAIFAWFALATSQDLMDPFLDRYQIYLYRWPFFLPLMVLVAVAFESRKYLVPSASPNAINPRLVGPIVIALFFPTAYFILIEGSIAFGGDIRFAHQIPMPWFAGLWFFFICVAVAAALFPPARVKADFWLAAGWAAPSIFVTSLEGCKFFGQSIMHSPAGFDEYSPGGILYWIIACAVGLLAVPLFVALLFKPPQPPKLQLPENSGAPATPE